MSAPSFVHEQILHDLIELQTDGSFTSSAGAATSLKWLVNARRLPT